MELRDALHVQLVDDRLRPGHVRSLVAAPVEAAVDDDALGNTPCVVAIVVEHRRACVRLSFDRVRVGIDEELVRVEAMPALRSVGALDAEPVTLPRPCTGNVPVPDERSPLLEAKLALDAELVEQTQQNARRVLRVEREVRALSVPGRTLWERSSRPNHAALRHYKVLTRIP
jgi:hypothetical protein